MYPSRASGVSTNSSRLSKANWPTPAMCSVSALNECLSTLRAVGDGGWGRAAGGGRVRGPRGGGGEGAGARAAPRPHVAPRPGGGPPALPPPPPHPRRAVNGGQNHPPPPPPFRPEQGGGGAPPK